MQAVHFPTPKDIIPLDYDEHSLSWVWAVYILPYQAQSRHKLLQSKSFWLCELPVLLFAISATLNHPFAVESNWYGQPRR
jgi:hypothetical protein